MHPRSRQPDRAKQNSQGGLGAAASTVFPPTENGGLHRSLSSGLASRGPVGLTHPTVPDNVTSEDRRCLT